MTEAPPSSLAARVQTALQALREAAQLRTLEVVRGINLCSNDYLGLAEDPRLRAAALEGVARAERVAATGARLLSGHAREWDELETEFAAFAGTPAALYFTSGYAANLGLLSALLGREDIAFSDRLNHASLIDGIRLSGARKVIYPHCDVDTLGAALAQHASEAGQKVVVTESLFSMDGDIAPLREMLVLARRYGAELVVDEAHATGVCGPEGRGLVAHLGLQREVFASVHTAGKALASMGAFVCGSEALKEFLINRARPFIFSTAAPPYLAHQLRAALRLARQADAERARLRWTADLLRSLLREAGFDCGASGAQIVPVILGENEAALFVAEGLRRAGFAVRAIRPPTVPPGTARLRLSLTCKITESDVRRLVDALSAACQPLARVIPANADD